MSPHSPIVRLENVDVDIDGHRVLTGIDLELARDRQLGIIGANGSGKSTLLALIAGKRWPAPGRGTRTYDFGAGPERDAVTARERVALIGHELQDLYFARGWNFRVLDIVGSGLTRSDIPKRRPPPGTRAQALALLARLQLERFAERRLLELSRGEQRRVLIARALAFGPALLLLDEPASGLDAAARIELERTLERAAASTPIVVSAHAADDLPRFVDTSARIEAGRLRTEPKPREPAERQPAQQQPAQHRPAQQQPSQQQPAPRQPAQQQRAEHQPNGRLRAAEQAEMTGSEPTAAAVIRVENASVWLEGRAVLDRLDFTLREGEHWLIEGPNGAGKSTLLKLLHAELRPARGGRIAWPGLGDPGDVWTLRRGIALVSPALQSRYLFPTTVFDAVASGFTSSIGRVRPVSAAEAAAVDALMAAFDLDGLRNRLLSTLSYGQRHRALIARTLATEPRVLLLDEPWEGLDAGTRDIVCRELIARMARGTQVVCVSHLGPGALPLNRRLALEAGSIVGIDATAGPPGPPGPPGPAESSGPSEPTGPPGPP